MKKIIIVLTILILVIGIAFFSFRSFNSSEEEEEVLPTPTVILPTISDDVQVSLTPKNQNREVVLTIGNIPKEIASIEYELTYITGDDLPRGVLGKIRLKGESEITRDDIVLGTCSSGRCVYDQGVTSIDLSLKFNKEDGASAIFQETYPLD